MTRNISPVRSSWLPRAQAAEPQNFLFTGSDDLAGARALLERPDIGGVQIVYNWKSLETAAGRL